MINRDLSFKPHQPKTAKKATKPKKRQVIEGQIGLEDIQNGKETKVNKTTNKTKATKSETKTEPKKATTKPKAKTTKSKTTKTETKKITDKTTKQSKKKTEAEHLEIKTIDTLAEKKNELILLAGDTPKEIIPIFVDVFKSTKEFLSGIISFKEYIQQTMKINSRFESHPEYKLEVNIDGSVRLPLSFRKLLSNKEIETIVTAQQYLDVLSRRHLGKILMALRLNARQSLIELSKKTNISVSTLSKYEKDPVALSRIKVVYLVRICNALQCDIGVLSQDIEESYRDIESQSSLTREGLNLKDNWNMLIYDAYIKSGLSAMRVAILSGINVDTLLYYMLNPIKKIDMHVVESLCSVLKLDIRTLFNSPQTVNDLRRAGVLTDTGK